MAVSTDDVSRDGVFRSDIDLHLQAGIESRSSAAVLLPEVDLWTGAILRVRGYGVRAGAVKPPSKIRAWTVRASAHTAPAEQILRVCYFVDPIQKVCTMAQS